MQVKISLLLFLFLATKGDPKWSDVLSQKVDKTVAKTYATAEYRLEPVVVDKDLAFSAPLPVNGYLFEVVSDQKGLGYVYVNEAPSMKKMFDYIVLFNSDLEIINTKVLIYRETHGRQIGTKRWLSQFFGMRPGDRGLLGENVDGITGATISVEGMTTAVNEVLETMGALKAKDLL